MFIEARKGFMLWQNENPDGNRQMHETFLSFFKISQINVRKMTLFIDWLDSFIMSLSDTVR